MPADSPITGCPASATPFKWQVYPLPHSIQILNGVDDHSGSHRNQ